MIKSTIEKFNVLSGRSFSGPTQVYVETFSACTNKCKMCPRTKIRNSYGYMKDDLFFHIISKLQEINFSGQLHLYGQSEPFLDRKIIERIHYAHTQLPQAKIILITNFTHLSDNLMDEILDSPIHNLSCSLYALDRENYKKICGQDNFEKTFINQIKFLKKYAKKIPFSFANYIIETPEIIADIKFINHYIFDIAPLGFAQSGKLCQLFNVQNNALEASRKYYSDCIYTNLKITPNGCMATCPCDSGNQLEIGNIKSSLGTVTEIYNNEKARKLRKKMIYNNETDAYCQRCEFRRSQLFTDYFLGHEIDTNDKYKHKQRTLRNSHSEIRHKAILFDQLFKDNAESEWLDVLEKLKRDFYAKKQKNT